VIILYIMSGEESGRDIYTAEAVVAVSVMTLVCAMLYNITDLS